MVGLSIEAVGKVTRIMLKLHQCGQESWLGTILVLFYIRGISEMTHLPCVCVMGFKTIERGISLYVSLLRVSTLKMPAGALFTVNNSVP